jgi:hypothetical protein
MSNSTYTTHNDIVQSEVPFGHLLYANLYVHLQHVDDIHPRSRAERSYLAWEHVRLKSNPYFYKGTGFEGYLVGRYTQPENALQAVLNIAQNTLDAIGRLYRFEFGFRNRLMHSLMTGEGDSECIQIWSAYFGAMLGRLRAQILNNRDAQNFRAHTYDAVRLLPPISYDAIEDDVMQTYAIGTEHNQATSKISITVGALPASQQDAWMVAENIGKFGHPLVREVLA